MSLINREDLIAAAKVRCEGCYNRKGTFCRACETQDTLDLIEDQPTVEQPRWIPVTERLPDTFGQFIVAVNNDFGNGYSDYADYDPYQRSWRTGLSLNGTECVTHWQPLPAPPTPEECSAVGKED